VPSATRSRRRRLLLASWGFALCGLACDSGPPPPSILLVTIDTLRRDHVGVYGDERALTPNLDALAAEGLVHEHAYTTMPTTGPAHLSAMTGYYPSQHGARRNGEPLPQRFRERELAFQLGRNGYATAAFVTAGLLANHVVGLRGFEVYDAPKRILRPGDDAVSDALAWLAVEKRRPILLWVHLYDPHAPYGTADEKGRSFPIDESKYGFVDTDFYADPARRREIETRYARGVRSSDLALGRLLEGARAALGPSLFVVVTSDHGETLSERIDERGFGYDHGKYLDREEVEIPLVVVGPGIAAGRSLGAVSLRDVYTTLLAASGIGDPRAADEGRRDLRRRDDSRRVVRIERRLFRSRVPDSVRDHAAAASDGERLVIVAEDGTEGGSASNGATAPADLLAEARAPLAASDDAAPFEIPRETRDSLRDLGYVE